METPIQALIWNADGQPQEHKSHMKNWYELVKT